MNLLPEVDRAAGYHVLIVQIEFTNLVGSKPSVRVFLLDL